MRQGILDDVSAVMKLAVDTGLFVSLCSISAPSGTLTASGAPDGLYVAVTGLQRIPCMDAPEAVDRYTITSTEARAVAQVESEERRHILLNRYYSLLSPATNWGAISWTATVDGVIYDIRAAEQDSQKQMTRLSLKRATV